MAEDPALIEQMKNVSLDGVTDKLTEAQIATVESLQKLQKNRDELESEFNKELNELRAKYDVLYKPLYEKRAKILTTASGSEYGTPSLPKFWLTAMKNNKVLRNVIEVRDEPILAYLTDVSAEFLEPKKQESFKITMSFDNNPYFTNKTLVKQYNMKSIDGEMESLLQCTEATKIEWLPDMDVTKQKVTKIQRHRRTKETRQKVELEDQPSFFRFFTSQEVPSSETLDRMTEQEIAELEMYVEEDYDIGIIIRDKLIPEAVYWYLGVVDNDDLDDDDVESYEHSDSLTSDSD